MACAFYVGGAKERQQATQTCFLTAEPGHVTLHRFCHGSLRPEEMTESHLHMLFCSFTSIIDVHEGVHGDFVRSIRKGNDCAGQFFH